MAGEPEIKDAEACVRPDPAFLAEADAGACLGVSRCYQCRKCTNGCPLAFAMDFMPNQVMRMVQLGLRDEVLRSRTIQVCASCQTCSTRCPNEIDIAHLMDVLRQIARRSGVPSAEPRIAAFNDAFLKSVRRHGRVFELGMTGAYKMATGDFTGDMGLGMKLFFKGRLKVLPSNVKARKAVRGLFDGEKAANKKCEGSEEGEGSEGKGKGKG